MVDLLRVVGGAERDRTDDLLLAKQALSQLSYSPFSLRHALLLGLSCTPLYTSRPRAAPGSRLRHSLLVGASRLYWLAIGAISRPGGSGWIRTIDPRLIKTVL